MAEADKGKYEGWEMDVECANGGGPGSLDAFLKAFPDIPVRNYRATTFEELPLELQRELAPDPRPLLERMKTGSSF